MQDCAPMTPAGHDRLKAILAGFPSANAMNLEELDGFFCALACSPEDVEPEDYFPPLWGTVEEADELFADLKAAQEFIGLVTRYYGELVLRLEAEEDFEPLLLANESGEVLGVDWAWGFVRGMRFEPDVWRTLFDDEQDGELLLPVLMLAQERDPDRDPDLPAETPITAEEREALLCGMAAAAPCIYDYFWEMRDGANEEYDLPAAPYRREMPKVGRNEPCSCGSGKKYKRCCGADAG